MKTTKFFLLLALLLWVAAGFSLSCGGEDDDGPITLNGEVSDDNVAVDDDTVGDDAEDDADDDATDDDTMGDDDDGTTDDDATDDDVMDDDADDTTDDDTTPAGVPMITIPGGEFGMGCPTADDGRCGRKYHVASVTTFEIDRYEVRSEHYRTCQDAGTCVGGGGDRCLTAGTPTCSINHQQATDYCAWVGKRLPTSAEWERAARGDGGHDYAWGDVWDPLKTNWCDGTACDGTVDGYVQGAPVDAFPAGASPYGVEQMTGNQLEWASDLVACDNGDDCAVVRGGSWGPPNGMGSPTDGLLAWNELKDPVWGGAPHMGFRCAR